MYVREDVCMDIMCTVPTCKVKYTCLLFLFIVQIIDSAYQCMFIHVHVTYVFMLYSFIGS